jgi:hypothetical protein
MSLVQPQPNINYSYGSALGSFHSVIPKSEGFVIGVNLPNERIAQKALVNETLIDLQKNNIVIKNYGDVYGYLSLHPKLISILIPICESTRQVFCSNTELSLELYSDPEIKDQYLTLYIRQSSYEKDVLDKINCLNEQCEKELSEVEGYLLITTDYQPPYNV